MKLRYGNGVQTEYRYGEEGELASLVTVTDQGRVLLNVTFSASRMMTAQIMVSVFAGAGLYIQWRKVDREFWVNTGRNTVGKGIICSIAKRCKSQYEEAHISRVVTSAGYVLDFPYEGERIAELLDKAGRINCIYNFLNISHDITKLKIFTNRCIIGK